MRASLIRKSIGCVLVATVLIISSLGCNQEAPLIERVDVKISENLQSLKVALVFSKRVQSPISGVVDLKKYGHLFVDAYTPTQPFAVGLDLDTAIFNDQDYIELTPTTTLPNGLPIGIPYPVVEIRLPEPVSPDFDLYGYADVLHTSWLGMATLLNVLDNNHFPVGLSITQIFYRDQVGQPGILASVFGPVLGQDGSIVRHGGISLFVNARQLIEQFGHGARDRSFFPEKQIQLNGPAAAMYEGRYDLLQDLELNLINSLNLR
jgi:hypothetical protein